MNKETVLRILRVSGYVANAMLALVTLMSAYGGIVNPDVSAIPAILAMTFPLWLGLTVAALTACLFFNRVMAIIPGVTILLCISPILSFCPLNLSREKLTPDEEARSFTFMSYNVYGLNDFRHQLPSPKDTTMLYQEVMKGKNNPTLSYIISQDADIVCMQEFWWTLKPNHRVVSPALLDSIYAKYPYRVMGAGNGILSKFPIYPVKLPKLNDATAFHLAAVAEIQGRRTLIVSVHLQSIGLDDSDKALYHEITAGEGGREAIAGAKRQLLSKLAKAFRNRAIQTRLIRSQIDSLGIENVIVAGDFNDIPDCYALRQLAKDDFKSAFSMAGCGPVITYHANRFYFQIDHILYRGKLDAVGYRKDDFDRSDHYPIMARFLWSETSPTVNRSLKGIDLINRAVRDTISEGDH